MSDTPSSLSQSDLLLQTKFFVPRVRTDFVSRKRLLAQINQHIHQRLILLAAPAGFGKTSLMSEWVRQTDMPVAWMTVDESDNDHIRFCRYVVSALRQVIPDIGEPMLDMLNTTPPPSLRIIVTLILNDIARIEGELVLVMDDYHLITNKTILDEMGYILDHLPPQLHLMIATRVDPPFPLARLRAQGQLAEIRAADLRFRMNEVTQLLNDVNRLHLSDAEVRALDKRIEGWAAGLQIAALSIQNNPDKSDFIASLSGSHHHILDYLVEEVFAHQPEHIRTFLLQTSILKQFNSGLCNTVTERDDSYDILEYLNRVNLFIVPLDEERQWFRYHHLFSEFLSARLRHQYVDVIDDLNRRAAEWYHTHNLVSEAIDYALVAKNIDYATNLMTEHVQELLWERRDNTHLERWLHALPDTVILSHPELLICQAWLLAFTDPGNRVEGFLQRAEAANTDNRPEIKGEIAAIRAESAFVRGDTEAALGYSEEALQHLPPSNIFLYSLILQTRGYILRSIGEMEQARQDLEHAAQLSDDHDIGTVSIFAQSDLAAVQMAEGQLRAAEQTLQAVLDDARRRGQEHSPKLAFAYVLLGDIYREWNRFAEAHTFLDIAEEMARALNYEGILRQYYIVQARIEIARGNFTAAEKHLDQALQHALFSPSAHSIVRAHQIRLYLLMDRVNDISNWIAEHDFSLETPPLYQQEFEYAVYARVLIQQNHLAEAQQIMEHLLEAASQGGRHGNVIEDRMILAQIYTKQGKQEGAVSFLKEALDYAAPEGYTRVFVDEGEPIRELLLTLLAQNTHTKTIQNVLPLFETQGQILAEDGLIESLSERELEVLRLLAADLSNPQIAEKLFIAPSTVKTHTLNIYRKLDVRNRMEAVQRARTLQLI